MVKKTQKKATKGEEEQEEVPNKEKPKVQNNERIPPIESMFLSIYLIKYVEFTGRGRFMKAERRKTGKNIIIMKHA